MKTYIFHYFDFEAKFKAWTYMDAMAQALAHFCPPLKFRARLWGEEV